MTNKIITCAGTPKKTMIEVMLRGESVGGAIRRLGSGSGNGDAQTKTLLSTFISNVNKLIDDGELDAYELVREDLEKGIFKTKSRNELERDDEMDDMFGEDEGDCTTETDANLPKVSNGRSAEGDNNAHNQYETWPINELRRFLRERQHYGICNDAIIEKQELVDAAKMAAAVEKRINSIVLRGFEATSASPTMFHPRPITGNLNSIVRNLTYDAIHDAFYYYYDPSNSKGCWLYKNGNHKTSKSNDTNSDTMYIDPASGYCYHIHSGCIYDPGKQKWFQ